MPNKVNYVLILFYILTSARTSTASPHTYTSEQTSGDFYLSVNSIYKPHCKWGILGRKKNMIDDRNIWLKFIKHYQRSELGFTFCLMLYRRNMYIWEEAASWCDA